MRLAGAARTAVEAGAVSEEQAARWLAQLEDADRADRFFSGLTAATRRSASHRAGELPRLLYEPG